jgi:hypothetical protein
MPGEECDEILAEIDCEEEMIELRVAGVLGLVPPLHAVS